MRIAATTRWKQENSEHACRQLIGISVETAIELMCELLGVQAPVEPFHRQSAFGELLHVEDQLKEPQRISASLLE